MGAILEQFERDTVAVMTPRTTRLTKAALSALYYSGAHRLMQPWTGGVGAVFMLHHVRPEPPNTFEPNRILKVTPEFLESVIEQVIEAGFDIVSLDEAHLRLTEGNFDRPFVTFTFDDGYKDNLVHAYPVFEKRRLPLTIYIPTDYPDGNGDLWWLALEKVVSEVDELRINMAGRRRTFRCDTPNSKRATYHDIYWWLRSIEEAEARRFVRELCRAISFNPDTLCRDLVMTWDEIRRLARDPLVTIGAHTRSHFALSKLTLGQARIEIEESVRRIERELGRTPVHFAYPYGAEDCAGPREFALCKELGLRTAVTTRKGLLYPAHGAQLTSLPRVSLNGDYQQRRYISVMLSGAPFYIWNGLRRVNAA